MSMEQPEPIDYDRVWTGSDVENAIHTLIFLMEDKAKRYRRDLTEKRNCSAQFSQEKMKLAVRDAITHIQVSDMAYQGMYHDYHGDQSCK